MKWGKMSSEALLVWYSARVIAMGSLCRECHAKGMLPLLLLGGHQAEQL